MARTIMANATLDESGSPDDSELIRLIAQKNRPAFEQLYRRYAHRVARFVAKMIRDPQTAEEVVDDTLFAIWTAAPSFRRQSTVSTWIFGIAYRQALKTLERGRRHTVVDTDTEALDRVADTSRANSPEQQAATHMLQSLVAKGIDALSDEHRTAVQLTAMGLSYREIADIVDCPANTVKTRMFYARRQLNEFLGRHNTTFSTDTRTDNND